jgi:hypothetical protein
LTRDKFSQSTKGDTTLEYRFQAGLLELKADTKRAVFYLMNTSRNRNRWGVSDKALEEALPSIKGKPIGCRAGYKPGHSQSLKPKPGEMIDVGKFVDYEKRGSYALGVAEITDEKALEKLKSGEWGAVSVIVKSFADHCSVCGESTLEQGFQHKCIASGPGYIISDSFAFVRTDFVDEPAYPQAGLQEILAEAARAAEQPITLLASYYNGGDSQSNADRVQGPGAPPNGGSKPDQENKAELTEKTPEELKAELKAAETKITQLTSDLQAANVKAQDVAQLRAEIDAQKAERHQAEVDAAAEARVKAGLAKDLAAEKLRLKDIGDAALRELKAAAEEVQRARSEAKPTGPKAKYETKEEIDEFSAAVNRRKGELALSPFKEMK